MPAPIKTTNMSMEEFSLVEKGLDKLFKTFGDYCNESQFPPDLIGTFLGNFLSNVLMTICRTAHDEKMITNKNLSYTDLYDLYAGTAIEIILKRGSHERAAIEQSKTVVKH